MQEKISIMGEGVYFWNKLLLGILSWDVYKMDKHYENLLLAFEQVEKVREEGCFLIVRGSIFKDRKRRHYKKLLQEKIKDK